jgi:hypothetical protein
MGHVLYSFSMGKRGKWNRWGRGMCEVDTTIADIEEFEEIRYPDKVLKHGAQMLVGWGIDSSTGESLDTAVIPIKRW